MCINNATQLKAFRVQILSNIRETDLRIKHLVLIITSQPETRMLIKYDESKKEFKFFQTTCILAAI